MKIQFVFIDEKSLNYTSVLLNKASLKTVVLHRLYLCWLNPTKIDQRKIQTLRIKRVFFIPLALANRGKTNGLSL